MNHNKIPVIVLAFNRPGHVKKAMEPIRKYKPDRIYLACDGPREDRDGEAFLVAETQKALTGAVDWPCEVKTLFRERNLGCDQAVPEAIYWFFEQEEYGIIIEDDVVVGLDFIHMCEELLPKYGNCEKIQQISAINFGSRLTMTNSYTFQKKPYTWGWATWRRSWMKYMNMTMLGYQNFHIMNLIKYYGIFQTLMMKYYWNKSWKDVNNSPWDTRWHFAAVSNDLISICPKVNLSVNIGCSSSGTHYHSEDTDPYSHLKIGKLVFPLVHPERIALDYAQLKLDNRDFLRVRILGAKKRILRLFHVK